jgi:hypothetical protein
MRGKKKEERRREGGPEKKITPGAKTQSGSPGVLNYSNLQLSWCIGLPPADISRSTENSAIWPAGLDNLAPPYGQTEVFGFELMYHCFPSANI